MYRQVGRRISGPLKGKLFSLSFNHDCGAESWLLHTTHNKKLLTGHLQEAAEQDITHAHTHTPAGSQTPRVCLCV